MRDAIDRIRSARAPDLWPEIERRLEQSPTAGRGSRGRRALPVLLVLALAGGVLAWVLTSLHFGSSAPAVTLTPGEIVRIPVGPAPQPITASDSLGVWVSTGIPGGGEELWRIDPRTDRATKLPWTRGAVWTAVGEGFAWATCGGAGNPCGRGSVLKLDPKTGATLATIRVPGPHAAITAGLGAVWVSRGTSVVKIDPAAARVVATYPITGDALGTAGRFLWVAGAGRNQNGVAAVGPSDGRIVHRVAFRDPCILLATEHGVWVASCLGGPSTGSGPDMLARIDPATGRVSYRVPLDEWGRLAYAEGHLWLAHWVGNKVDIEALDPATGRPTGSVITVRPGPRPWISEGIGPPAVSIAVAGRSFWLTHVDASDVVRVGIGSGGGPVPWVDRPAPAYTPRPTPSPTFPSARPCRGSDLRLVGTSTGVGLGNVNLQVSLRNVSSSPCELRGYPTLSGVRADGTAASLHPRHGSYFGDPGPTSAARPGWATAVNVSGSDSCTKRTPYRFLRLGLPAGGSIDVRAPDFIACGVGVSRFGVPRLAREALGPTSPLQVRIHAPRTVRLGSTLRYTVTVTNTGKRPYSLQPCPSYEESLLVGPSPKDQTERNYYLNCDKTHAIAPHEPVTFAMRIQVPTTLGIAKLGWQLHVTGLPGSAAGIRVVR